MCGAGTCTVHDSRDLLTSHPDTLWCPVSVCTLCFVIDFCDRFLGSSETIIRVSSFWSSRNRNHVGIDRSCDVFSTVS